MHEVMATGALSEPRAAQQVHDVLALPGDLTSEHLLELARCCVPQDRVPRLHTLAVGADHAAEGWHEPAENTRPDYHPERVGAILHAVHETGARSVVLGYPGSARGRSHFTDVVERVTAATDVDVVVCVERHQRPWRRVLVPYLYGPLDRAALGVARRLARRGDAEVTVLHVMDAAGDDEVMTLRAAVGDCTLKVVTANDPVAAAADEARRGGYDVVVLGGRPPRAARGRYFTMRQQRLLLATDASLVVVHVGTDDR